MKKMGRYFVMTLAMLLAACISLSGCTGNGTGDPTGTTGTGDPTGTTGTDTGSSTGSDEGAATPDPATLTLDGVDISSFCIVYEAPADKAALGSYWKDEYDHGLVSARRLADLIKAKFGVELPIYSDATREEGDYEILVGRTNRSETSVRVLPLRQDAYNVSLRNKKMIVCGGSAGATYHAIDALETYFAAEAEGDAYAIAKTQKFTGTYDLQKIAILGDSITYGALSTNYTTNGALFGYVAHVQRMLWQDALVSSYAKPGACMRSDLDGFINFASTEWNNFLSDSGEFDIVLIMLGTNDGYCDTLVNGEWTGVWTDADDASFLSSAEFIVSKVAEENPDVRMALMNCPVYYRTAATHASHYHVTPRTLNLQAQAVTDLRADGYDIHLYDMNSYSAANTTASMFPDLLHPGDAGHLILAQGVVNMLPLLIAGETDQYLLN